LASLTYHSWVCSLNTVHSPCNSSHFTDWKNSNNTQNLKTKKGRTWHSCWLVGHWSSS
jgi:hypothetical protein